MKRSLLCKFILLYFCFNSFGQNYYGFKLGGGSSYLSSKIDAKLIPNSTQKFYWRPSFQGGYFYNHCINKYSSIGLELLFNKIIGLEKMETKLTDQNGDQTGQMAIATQRRHISHLSIPLYYEYKTKKLTVNLGVQFSLRIYSKFYLDVQSPIPLNYSVQPSIILNTKFYDFGGRAGLEYSLTKKLALETTFYYGLIDISRKNTETFGYPDISKNNAHDMTWKVQQVSVGLRYKILKQEKHQ